jgi:hypothetical protein
MDSEESVDIKKDQPTNDVLGERLVGQSRLTQIRIF